MATGQQLFLFPCWLYWLSNQASRNDFSHLTTADSQQLIASS
ncbi:hypothetical protein Hsw_2978 [Hymenobacter swuensis DY53]|uniref:Uncharacterized protein n=1 Tax=Hymenobacter swuensis DY53 TaxID=1227739 RepID=W8F0Z6_9BACT|nr:hypothetical protein Hsw_2978 [Hymenobacter swuensis DY53]